MISLKSLVKYVKEAKITAPKKGKETPLDAKVQIPVWRNDTKTNARKYSKIYC